MVTCLKLDAAVGGALVLKLHWEELLKFKFCSPFNNQTTQAEVRAVSWNNGAQVSTSFSLTSFKSSLKKCSLQILKP